MSFLTSLYFIRFAEGGDNMRVPTDMGGHTIYGISERAHPKDDPRFTAFWADPTPEAAAKIYYDYYWTPNRVEDLPEHYQAVHFDSLVNHNPIDAGRIFQRGLGGLTDDGVIGERTLGRAWQDQTRVDEILAERSAFYFRLVQRIPAQEANWIGWIRRSMRLARYALGVQYGIPIHPHGEMSRYD